MDISKLDTVKGFWFELGLSCYSSGWVKAIMAKMKLPVKFITKIKVINKYCFTLIQFHLRSKVWCGVVWCGVWCGVSPSPQKQI